MGKPLSEEARALVDGANPAHLATLMPDGSPKVEPVWIGREGDLLLMTTDWKNLKAGNLQRDGRVAISIVNRHDPYEQLLVRGFVAEVRSDDDLVLLDELSQTYLGTPFPRRRWSGRAVFVIEATTARYYHSPLKAADDASPSE